MKTYPKKRIEIIIEAPLARRITTQLDRVGTTGYSVIPLIGGRGLSGPWSADGHVGSVSGMVSIVCITDENLAAEVLDESFSIVSRQLGIVSISDVMVIRSEHF